MFGDLSEWATSRKVNGRHHHHLGAEVPRPTRSEMTRDRQHQPQSCLPEALISSSVETGCYFMKLNHSESPHHLLFNMSQTFIDNRHFGRA